MTDQDTKAAANSRASAGLSQNTDQAIAYETGFTAGIAYRDQNPPAELLALVEALDQGRMFSQCVATRTMLTAALSAWRKRGVG